MRICEICKVTEEEVRLFDAIYEGMMNTFCERCSIIENIPIIRKPNAEQLRNTEKVTTVSDRMNRLSGIKGHKSKETFFIEDRLKELEDHPEMELPEVEKLNLVDNFHWDIIKTRRRIGLTKEQLAQSIGESLLAIDMIEKKKLPENGEILIRKLEQYFQIKLRKIEESKEEDKPVLLDESGRELEVIPEEEIESTPIEKNELEAEENEGKKINLTEYDELGNLRDFNIKSHDLEKVSIGDLQKLHRKKVEVTKVEKIEEQKKIEERRRFLHALRERDRIKLESKKRQELAEKKRIEEERSRLLERRNEELNKKKEQDYKEIDKYLGGSELLESSNNANQENSKEKFDD